MPRALRLAQVSGDRQTRDGAGLAPEGLEGLLALAVLVAGRAWSAPYRVRAQIARLTYGLGEPLVGPATDQGRVGQAGVHSLGSYRRQIHALGTRPGIIVQLAKFSQTACRGYLGLRPLLRLDPVVPNSLCLFRDPSRKPRMVHVRVTQHPTALLPLNMRATYCHDLQLVACTRGRSLLTTFRWLCLGPSISTLR